VKVLFQYGGRKLNSVRPVLLSGSGLGRLTNSCGERVGSSDKLLQPLSKASRIPLLSTVSIRWCSS